MLNPHNNVPDVYQKRTMRTKKVVIKHEYLGEMLIIYLLNVDKISPDIYEKCRACKKFFNIKK